jgi:plastocyanin
MKRFKWISVSIAVVASALVLSCGAGAKPVDSPGGKISSDVVVKIDNFSFGPATITIPAGSTVTWTNHDDVPHVVSSDDNKLFKSTALDTDDHFSFTFAKPGTYNYYCAIHPKMTARIVVQ